MPYLFINYIHFIVSKSYYIYMKKILFLGDSITEGVGATSIDNCYVNKTCKYLNCVGKNYGISGTRIAEQKISHKGLISFDDSFFSRAKRMEKDADVVICFGGTNDYGHGDAIIGNKDDTDLYTFYGAINNLFTYLIEKYNKEKIIIILPLHRYEEENLYGDNNSSRLHPTLNLLGYTNIIIETAQKYGLFVIDFRQVLGKPTSINNEGFFIDGLHPNDLGHDLLAKHLSKIIKERFDF